MPELSPFDGIVNLTAPEDRELPTVRLKASEVSARNAASSVTRLTDDHLIPTTFRPGDIDLTVPSDRTWWPPGVRPWAQLVHHTNFTPPSFYSSGTVQSASSATYAPGRGKGGSVVYLQMIVQRCEQCDAYVATNHGGLERVDMVDTGMRLHHQVVDTFRCEPMGHILRFPLSDPARAPGWAPGAPGWAPGA